MKVLLAALKDKKRRRKLGEEILEGRTFIGNKIWQNWWESNLVDDGKHIYWQKLHLAGR